MSEKLTREQVEGLVEFATGMAYGEMYGAWSPFMSNALLQNLNNDAKEASSKAIRKALSDYRNNAETIHSYMEYMSFFDMIFAKTVKNYANSLAFDLQCVCINADESDYNTKAYKDDKKRIDDFLLKFDYKGEFRKVVEQVLLHEVYYCWWRKTKWGNRGNMKFALQMLPQDRCMLTGMSDIGPLFDFDMNYFLQVGVDINAYDPAFKRYYQRVFGAEAKPIESYRPTNPFNERTGTYAMWTQTSPTDGAFAFKMNLGNFNTTPYLAPLLKSAITDDEVQQLQLDKDMNAAYGILAGAIQLFDNAKSGTQKNQFSIDLKTLGSLMGKVKQGLGNTLKVVAMPTEDNKFFQFNDQNPDMYNNQVKSTAATGSNVSRVVYSSDRMSNAEVEAGQNETYQTMRPLYDQFSKFMNFFGNQLTKKFKWQFVFEGATYRYERQQRIDTMFKYADKGIVLDSSAWASAMGMNPVLFEKSLVASKNTGWTKNLQLLMNANTSKDGGNSGGRPQLDPVDKSESAQQNDDQ
nr:MAG TPA: portal protein [Caudoviricetes sp.]